MSNVNNCNSGSCYSGDLPTQLGNSTNKLGGKLVSKRDLLTQLVSSCFLLLGDPHGVELFTLPFLGPPPQGDHLDRRRSPSLVTRYGACRRDTESDRDKIED